MGIFNQAAESIYTPDTTNVAGAKAFTVDPRYELASILLTSFVKDKFYRSKETERDRLVALLNQVDPLFAAKAAIYARNEFGMRSITHIMAGELANRTKYVPWTSAFFKAVSRRPDDMLEILAYYLSRYGDASKKNRRSIPNAMKRGFAKRLTEFDAYQLGKYRSLGKNITLLDLVNLVHPKSTEALTKLMKGELQSTGTFEGEISSAGRAAALADGEEDKLNIKAEAWGDLIKNRKIGYMALLKNLRNIMQQAPRYIGETMMMLQDRALIKKSLVLPFRYYTAYKEIQEESDSLVRTLLPALASACDIALDNVPKLPGRTLIALDKSGSMSGQIEMASQFAAVLYKANDASLVLFDSSARYLRPSPAEATLTLQQMILMNCRDMGGTDFNSLFKLAMEEKYDRFIFISDEQHWRGESAPAAYKAYCAAHKAAPSIFVVDTAGYGSLAFPASKVYAVAGFSEKIFDLMKMLEEDRTALVNRIEAVQFN